MALRNIPIVGLAIALLLVSACSRAVTKAYPGPSLPRSETAVVESGAYTGIVGLDGQGVRGEELSILPGPHTIKMKILESRQPTHGTYALYSNVDGSVNFAAEPGHTYLVSVNFVASPSAPEENDSGFRWVGYVTDRTAKRVVGHTDYLPLQASFINAPGP